MSHLPNSFINFLLFFILLKECPSSKTFEESVIKHTSEEKDNCVAEMSEDGQRECIGTMIIVLYG